MTQIIAKNVLIFQRSDWTNTPITNHGDSTHQPKGTASDRFELLILNASFRQKHQNAAEDDDNA